MIHALHIRNYGPLSSIDWKDLRKINLVIGNNGTGKTFILKAAYSAIKAAEEYRRGDEPRKLADILATKLYWTFQIERLGDLVGKGQEAKLEFRAEMDEGIIAYGFGESTNTTLLDVTGPERPRSSNSLFLPEKEILTLYKVIIDSRETGKMFGFDDTYYDLAKVIAIRPTKGKNYQEFAEARQSITNLIEGDVFYQEEKERWVYKKGRFVYPIGVASEGVKKLAILDTLLGNRYLDPDSVIFIDEPESALHPQAISRFMQTIRILAGRGIQFFISTHSYFVLKSLALLARKNKESMPVLSLEDGAAKIDDLQTGFPDNPIVQESVREY
jgi:AAA15 family ATPase/GTPase